MRWREWLEGLAVLPLPWDDRPGKRASAEDWIKRGLIVLACLWLMAGVALPLLELAQRATHIELPVIIDEPTEEQKAQDPFRGEIKAGGRVLVLLRENRRTDLYLGNRVFGTDGIAETDGLRVEYSDNRIERVVLSAVSHRDHERDGARRAIRPLVLERHPTGVWIVDGSRLTPGASVHMVRRFIGLENFMNYFGLRGLSQSRLLGLLAFVLLLLVLAGRVARESFARAGAPRAMAFAVVLMLGVHAARAWGRIRAYGGHTNLARSATNSFLVALFTTVIAVALAFVYAYGLTRTRMRGKLFFRIAAMLPLFAPTMLYGLSLVYLFGNQGIFTTGFFGRLPWLRWDIGLYGPVGVILAETAFTFPPAMMILSVALSNTDARLYEAAASLGAGPAKTFFTVTLPNVKYGLLSAVFVCFTLSFTDFGAPKIVGGQFNVLAVDIYKQVIGQQNFGMGATVSIILLAPTLLAFVADRAVQRRSHAAVTARSVPFQPSAAPWRDAVFTGFCSLIALFLLALLFTAGVGSFVTFWPYAFSHPEIYPRLWTVRNYLFHTVGGGGYRAFFTSLRMAGYTALVGTAVTFISAYLIEKTRGAERTRKAAYLLSIVPLALPGLVIGIAYVFFFNKPAFAIPFTSLSLPNPFASLYGTMALLVLCNIVHFYTVAFLTATTALRQLDKEFEVVSESMAVPFYRTFARVTVPVCVPAIVEIAAFYFVSSMATVSGVIFLYTSRLPLASVAVVNMDDAGDTAAAAAMCMLIVGANIIARALAEGVCVLFNRRTQAWRKR